MHVVPRSGLMSLLQAALMACQQWYSVAVHWLAVYVCLPRICVNVMLVALPRPLHHNEDWTYAWISVSVQHELLTTYVVAPVVWRGISPPMDVAENSAPASLVLIWFPLQIKLSWTCELLELMFMTRMIGVAFTWLKLNCSATTVLCLVFCRLGIFSLILHCMLHDLFIWFLLSSKSVHYLLRNDQFHCGKMWYLGYPWVLENIRIYKLQIQGLESLENEGSPWKSVNIVEYDLLVLENFDWIMEGYSFELSANVSVNSYNTVCFPLITYFR